MLSDLIPERRCWWRRKIADFIFIGGSDEETRALQRHNVALEEFRAKLRGTDHKALQLCNFIYLFVIGNHPKANTNKCLQNDS